MNILITSAGRRNELISYFKEISQVNNVVVCDMSPYAAAFEECDIGYIAPPLNNKEYGDFIYELCKKESIDIVITLNDIEIPLLAKMKDRLNSIETKLIVSDSNVIDICWDKKKTTTFLKKSNFLVPQDYSFNEINEDLNSFPLIIKPRFGTASIGVEVVQSYDEFQLLYDYAKHSLGKTLIANIDGGEDLLIQEKINGTEYAVDIINDLSGNYQGCVIKEKLGIRGGDADCVITVHDEVIEMWCKEFSAKLKHISNVDCDLIRRGDNIYCVDINPRFGGAYPFSHLSGVNLPAMIVAWAGNTGMDKKINYPAGIITARTERYLELANIHKQKKLDMK